VSVMYASNTLIEDDIVWSFTVFGVYGVWSLRCLEFTVFGVYGISTFTPYATATQCCQFLSNTARMVRRHRSVNTVCPPKIDIRVFMLHRCTWVLVLARY